MSKRFKYINHKEERTDDMIVAGNESSPCLPSNGTNQVQLPSTSDCYHTSLCGSILYSTPTISPTEIFSYLAHSNLSAFHRSLDIHHKDIIRMKNHHEQTVLHLLTIYTYPHKWIRLVMMRGCDTCAQDIDGYTAAHYAVERDDIEMLKALTIRFSSQIKPFSEQHISDVYDRGCKALSLRNHQGLTVFMLACHHESLKCLQYLIELNINDVHLQDEFGDTCLHYAVARRNESLVEKLLHQCHADVNGGNEMRPSVLDILQFNREQQRIYDRLKDNAIEQILRSHHACNRCQLRRTIQKRKQSVTSSDTSISELVCLTVDISVQSQIDQAQDYARRAFASENIGELVDAQENYQRAMDCLPPDVLDRAVYGFSLATMQMVRGEYAAALKLVQEALELRQRFERDTEEIHRLEQTIENIQQHLLSEIKHCPSNESN